MEWRESERLRRKSLGVVVPWNPYSTVVIIQPASVAGGCLLYLLFIQKQKLLIILATSSLKPAHHTVTAF